MSRGPKYYLTWPHTKRQHYASAGVLFLFGLLALLVDTVVGLLFVAIGIATLLRVPLLDGPGGAGFG